MVATGVLRRARAVDRLLRAAGIDLRKLVRAPQDAVRLYSSWRLFSQDYAGELEFWPILGDWRASAGTASGHYFHQDLWAARRVLMANPSLHVDVGSRVDGFVAHLLCAMPVTVVDIRPLSSSVEGLTFVRDDMTVLSSFATGSVESLSCLHALEHVGLGRYGDPVSVRALADSALALSRVLSPGGRLYLGVPIGKERVAFNANRILSPQAAEGLFPELELVSFAAVDDQGAFHVDAKPDMFADSYFSLGLYEFIKPTLG